MKSVIIGKGYYRQRVVPRGDASMKRYHNMVESAIKKNPHSM